MCMWRRIYLFFFMSVFFSKKYWEIFLHYFLFYRNISEYSHFWEVSLFYVIDFDISFPYPYPYPLFSKNMILKAYGTKFWLW